MTARSTDEVEELIAGIARKVCVDVCELPDRTSPDDWPEACLVTSEELHIIVTERLNEELLPESEALTVMREALEHIAGMTYTEARIVANEALARIGRTA
jgi:hypothetical protein